VHESLALAGAGVGRQEADGGIVRDLAGGRIDRGQGPEDLAGGDIDAG